MVYAPGVGTKDWTGMAVPVTGADNEVVAALSVVYRRGTERPLTHEPAMHTAAAGISRVLTHGDPYSRRR
jgi:DNA-binding IclR family transcriptional regulator